MVKVKDFFSIYNINNFIKGYYNKWRNSRGDLPEEIHEQAVWRASQCQDCVENGACLKCECKIPEMFYAPDKVDALCKWGEMMSKTKWKEFKKDGFVSFRSEKIKPVFGQNNLAEITLKAMGKKEVYVILDYMKRRGKKLWIDFYPYKIKKYTVSNKILTDNSTQFIKVYVEDTDISKIESRKHSLEMHNLEAQKKPDKEVITFEHGTTIKVLHGSKSEHKTLPFSFRFTNISDDDLMITAIKSSCACIVDNTQTKLILPKQSSEITGHFDTTNKDIGLHKKIVAIEFNGVHQYQLEVHVKLVK